MPRDLVAYAEPAISFLDTPTFIRRRAVQILGEKGWWQQGPRGVKGGYACLLIALGEAHRQAGVEMIFPLCGFSTPGLMSTWNDEPGRTLGEVVYRLLETTEKRNAV